MIAMSDTVIEHISAELLRNGETRNVRLRLTVKEMRSNESVAPVARAVARPELMRSSGMSIEDGPYTLRYAFDGRLESYSVRVQSGMLLAN